MPMRNQIQNQVQGGMHEQENIIVEDYQTEGGAIPELAGKVKGELEGAAKAQPPSPASSPAPDSASATRRWMNAKNPDELAAFPEYAVAVQNARDGSLGLEDQAILNRYEELSDEFHNAEPVVEPRRKRPADYFYEAGSVEADNSGAALAETTPVEPNEAPVEEVPVEAGTEVVEEEKTLSSLLAEVARGQEKLARTREKRNAKSNSNSRVPWYNSAKRIGENIQMLEAGEPQLSDDELDSCINTIRYFDAHIETLITQILKEARNSENKKSLTPDKPIVGSLNVRTLNSLIRIRVEATQKLKEVREELEAQGKEVIVPKEVGEAPWEEDWVKIKNIVKANHEDTYHKIRNRMDDLDEVIESKLREYVANSSGITEIPEDLASLLSLREELDDLLYRHSERRAFASWKPLHQKLLDAIKENKETALKEPVPTTPEQEEAVLDKADAVADVADEWVYDSEFGVYFNPASGSVHYADEEPLPENLGEVNIPAKEEAGVPVAKEANGPAVEETSSTYDPIEEFVEYINLDPGSGFTEDESHLADLYGKEAYEEELEELTGVEEVYGEEIYEEEEEEEEEDYQEEIPEEEVYEEDASELEDKNKENKEEEVEEEEAEEPAIFRTYGLERLRRIRHELKLHDKYKKFWNPKNLWKIFDGFVEDKDKKSIKPGEELTECIVRFCDILNVEVTDKSDAIFFSVMCKFLGVNPDRSNKLFGEKQGGKNPPKIPVGTLVMSLDIMEKNIKEGEHFFAYRHDGLKLYDTPCFPVPIFSPEEIEFMTAEGALYEGVPASEIIDAANIEWKKNIYPKIKEEGDIALQKSYETFVRFMNDYTYYSHGGALTSGHWGVPDVYHAFPSEIIQEFPLTESGELSPDVKESAEMVKEAIIREMVHQTVYKAQKGGRYRSSVARDFRELGYTERDISATESQLAATNIIEGTAKACAALSLFPDVFLAGSSAAEAAIGNVETKGILYFRHLTFSEEEKQDFVMSHKLRELCHTDEVYEMISTIKVIDNSFGRAATIRYLSEENIYTPETATAWVNKHFGSKNARKKAKGGLEESRWLARMNKFYDAMQNIQTGEWIARRYDAELFIDSFLVNQRNKKKKFGEEGVYITSEDLLNSFKMDPKKSIRDLLLTKEGLQAYAWSQLRTLGGNSLVAARYERYANEHRIAGSAIRFFIANFPMFMLNATSRLNPLLHTSQLVSLKTRSQFNGRELNQQDFFEMLATDDFLQALKLDMLRAPGCVARIAICCAIYALIPGDFDEPEDEDKKGMWDEWVFGVQYDENGNRIIGSGFRARQMWYMYDILGWAGPSSVAIYAFFTGKASLSEACAILTDGMSDIVFDLAPGEFVNMLHDFDKTWQQAQALALSDGVSDPESLTPPETAIDYLGSVFSVSSLDFITRKFTPRVVREFWTAGWGPDFIAPDPTTIFTADPNDGDNTEYVEDWTERNLRIKASKNPVMGILLNIASGFYWNDDPTKQMTGYAPWNMPDMEKADTTNVAFYSHFYSITGEYDDGVFTGSDESVLGIEECFRIIDGVSAKFPPDQVGSYLAQNGLCLPPHAQYAMVGYCWWQMSELREQYYSGRITYDIYSEQYDYYQSKVDLLNSGVIPTSPKRYKQWKTDYQAYYKDSEGEYHSELAYQLRNAPVLRNIFDLMGVDDIEVEFFPAGTYDTPAQLISAMVHSTESSYDAQTLAAWQGDFTDPEFVKMMCEELDLVIEYGRDAGKNVWEVITGDEQAFQADGSIKFVIGSRAYTPIEEPIEYEEDDDGGNSGGSGGGGGRGYGGYTYVGAGSYKPKIYSNPRSVNNDRAATMYAKTPYTANRTYLRPAFFTKGSREAYRRQDM